MFAFLFEIQFDSKHNMALGSVALDALRILAMTMNNKNTDKNDELKRSQPKTEKGGVGRKSH